MAIDMKTNLKIPRLIRHFLSRGTCRWVCERLNWRHKRHERGQMDMQKCENHKGKIHNNFPGEQQVMMNKNIMSMSPEMLTRMQATLDKCNAS